MHELMAAYPSTIDVRDIDPTEVANEREQKAVLAMQATSLLGTDKFAEANAALTEYARQLNLAPTMTYEDLIFTNPLEHGCYVLSEQPEVAEQEALFYRAHRDIETNLVLTIKSLQSGAFETVSEQVRAASNTFVGLRSQLEPKSFAAFRPYFVGLNGHPGPSGLFSAAIPIIDLLTHGGKNMSDKEQYRLLQDIGRGLYPSHQAHQLASLLIAKHPRLDMPEDTRQEIVGLLNRFRKIHTGNVRKFVPEVLEAAAAGSGGVVNVAGYLASKIIHTEKNI